MNIRSQNGQTLLETIIAIFILTTALSSGLALMIFSFSNSANAQNEIIASNLAREGVEVVRSIRDSNWLAQEDQLAACSDIGDRPCYPNAYSGITAGNRRVVFNTTTGAWTLDSTADYNLYLQSNGAYNHTINGTSFFGRMVNISFNSASPYTNQNSNQELIIKSVVAWRGKNCTTFNANTDLLALNTRCKVVVEEHLTNWKDYK